MFLRVLNVTFPGKMISNLRIDFDIMQTNRAKVDEPNGGEIRIYNMAPLTRGLVAAAKGKPFFLNAGHLDNLPAVLFSGALTGYQEENSQTDLISILEVEDRGGLFGVTDIGNTSVSINFPPGVTANSIIASIASLGALPLVEVPFTTYVFFDGYSYSGTLKGALDEVVRDTLGANWYILDSALHVEYPDRLGINIPGLINATTGLIGGVEKFEEEEKAPRVKGQKRPKGIKAPKTFVTKYRFKTLVSPRYFVGQTIRVQSGVDKIDATGKIESIHKYGSNWSSDFYNEYVVRAI